MARTLRPAALQQSLIHSIQAEWLKTISNSSFREIWSPLLASTGTALMHTPKHILLILCGYLAFVYVCAPHARLVHAGQRGHQIPWD